MVKLSKGDLDRRIIEEVVYTGDGYDRIRINDLIAEHGMEADLVIIMETYDDYSYYSTTMKVVKQREENDTEYETRLAVIRDQKTKAALARKRAKEKAVEKDRALFESLKSKHKW